MLSKLLGLLDGLDFLGIYDRRRQVTMFVQVVDEEMENLDTDRPEPFEDNISYLADQQMRAMFKYMLGDSPVRTLWGLSFINKSLRVYSGDKETGKATPADIGPTSKSDWNIDILSPIGFETMKNIVQDIKKNNTVNPTYIGRYDDIYANWTSKRRVRRGTMMSGDWE